MWISYVTDVLPLGAYSAGPVAQNSQAGPLSDPREGRMRVAGLNRRGRDGAQAINQLHRAERDFLVGSYWQRIDADDEVVRSEIRQ